VGARIAVIIAVAVTVTGVEGRGQRSVSPLRSPRLEFVSLCKCRARGERSWYRRGACSACYSSVCYSERCKRCGASSLFL
jgi:hypothetical protein